MRLPAVLAMGLLAATLSGCAEGEFLAWEGEGEPAVDSNSNFTAPPPTNATDNTTVNTPPVANLTADVLNGTAPLVVNFTLAGSDPDGDNLTWTFAVNGTEVASGTQLPGSANHTFADVGLWNVSFVVHDGHASASALLAVQVNAAAGAKEEWTGPAPLMYEGETVVVDPLFLAGVGCWATYGALPTGDGYHMQEDRGGWTYAFDESGHEAEFYDSGNSAFLGGGSSGTVPDGAHYVDVCAAGADGLNSAYRLVIYPPGHPDAPA